MSITEREIFERFGKMMGWDLSRGDNGKYTSQAVEDIWYGWKVRADMERAKSMGDYSRQLTMIDHYIARGGTLETKS